MKKNHPNIYLLCSVIYAIDKDCRIELGSGIVVSERDYVSNLTKGVRDFWLKRTLPCFAHSQTLPPAQESLFGCDAVIIIKQGNDVKVCLFEAKWPHLTAPSHPWDYIQQSSGISHFSDQLRRQARWTKQAAIWELFMLEHLPGQEPKNFDSWASTCVWHRDAYPFDNTYRNHATKWNNAALSHLINNHVHSKPKNLRKMVQAAAQCNAGIYTPVTGGQAELLSEDGSETVVIPATIQALESDAEAFCIKNGIANLLFIGLDEDAV